MLFNRHLELQDKHAFLSPSSHSWLNYDEIKLESRFHTIRAARRGTDLHKIAHEAIRLGVRFAENNQAMADYVNDAIEFRMLCEQPLYYSDNCFGTPDTISFRENLLRIHDLKTGIVPVKEKQLEVYAALFCLEYSVSPYDIDIELRIYQREEIRIYDGVPSIIESIMDTIVRHDHQLQTIISEEMA